MAAVADELDAAAGRAGSTGWQTWTPLDTVQLPLPPLPLVAGGLVLGVRLAVDDGVVGTVTGVDGLVVGVGVVEVDVVGTRAETVGSTIGDELGPLASATPADTARRPVASMAAAAALKPTRRAGEADIR